MVALDEKSLPNVIAIHLVVRYLDQSVPKCVKKPKHKASRSKVNAKDYTLITGLPLLHRRRLKSGVITLSFSGFSSLALQDGSDDNAVTKM